MAMKLLLKGKPWIRLYRHDLQSFFWVLIHFVITHNPTQCTISWTHRDLIFVGKEKADFLPSLEAPGTY